MNVSRKGFFSGLLAMATAMLAKAQTPTTIITPCRPKLQWGNQLPLCNGQCPNPDCDYRAEPFTTAQNIWPLASSVRLNRCPKCNIAFWQDPEPEPKP